MIVTLITVLICQSNQEFDWRKTVTEIIEGFKVNGQRQFTLTHD